MSECETINSQLFAHSLSNLVEDRRFAGLSALKSFDVNSRSKDKNPIKTKYLMITSKKESSQETGDIKCKCFSCQETHSIRKCPKFLLLDVLNQKRWVKDHKACERCLLI